MVSTSFENISFVTFSQDYDRKKVFHIETATSALSRKGFELLARRFCKAHGLSFGELSVSPTYSIGPWQHSPLYSFTAEAGKNCTFYNF